MAPDSGTVAGGFDPEEGANRLHTYDAPLQTFVLTQEQAKPVGTGS